MRLQQIVATPHPAGNRIVLHWHNPSPDQYPGVRVMRREDTHPTAWDDGQLVVEGTGLETVEDWDLKGETVYYYTLFPYTANPSQYDAVDLHHNRTAAMATAPYNMAGQMYDLLPGIYHRYDTVTPNRAAAEVVIFLVLLLATAGLYRFLWLLLQNYPPVITLEDTKRGQLRRFLDLPGGQLDQLYSFATALLNLYDLERVDGRLLPLLAEWIGWQTDYRLEIAKQRNEIRYAPYLYQTIGLIPTLEATVKRILGWESRTKEFVHNVFRTNCPERLNLWLRQRNSKGEWSQPTAPLSLNFAYEGRPTAVRDDHGVLWLFYHRLKQGYGSNSEGQGAKQERWEIWSKTYRTKEGWSPSQPLVSDRQIEKYPTAALQGTKLWLFWTTFLETEQRWQLNYRTCTNGTWSPVQLFIDDRRDRRQPWATSDGSGGLWLFWSERVGTQWQLKYNRHDGNTWQLATAATFPLDNGVESDLFVLFHPSDTAQPLWVFWSRKKRLEDTANQTRWQIAYRVKQSLDPNVTTDWREVRTLPWAVPAEDDREPAALVNENGSIELFWSSTRSGSWSLWHTLLDTTTHRWGTAEPITTSPYSQRTPLCIPAPAGTLLIYRSNQSLSYASKTYGATDTTDFRYAGCTSVDTRNRAKIALREQFEDFQTYTYAVKKTERKPIGFDWYAWYARQDTVGLFLTPTTEDRDLLSREQELLKNVLPQFLPIQMRVEFFLQPFEIEETYNAAQTVIETATDVGIGDDAETYREGMEVASDRIPQWQLFYTNDPHCLSANLTVSPAESRSRTWHPVLDIDAETYNKVVEVASDRIPQWQLFYTNNSNCLSANLTGSPAESRSRTWHPVFADNELPTPNGGNP